MRLERILVPTDFSPVADAALERAIGLALHHDAHLQLFHGEILHMHDPVKAAASHRTTMRKIEALRESWEEGGRPSSAQFEYVTVRSVSAYDAITQAAHEYDPDLIVMATRGGGPFVGSLTDRVVFNSSHNVLTCRGQPQGNWPSEAGRILVPVDFSDNSKRAVEAARFYGGSSCPLTLLHVVEAPQRPALYAGRIPRPFTTDPGLEGTIAQHLREWAADLVADVVVVEGEVRSTILDFVRQSEAVLVVVGTSGLRGVRQHVVGTTAQHLSRRSAAPVLVVR